MKELGASTGLESAETTLTNPGLCASGGICGETMTRERSKLRKGRSLGNRAGRNGMLGSMGWEWRAPLGKRMTPFGNKLLVV
jgi:hypothetical protein